MLSKQFASVLRFLGQRQSSKKRIWFWRISNFFSISFINALYQIEQPESRIALIRFFYFIKARIAKVARIA